MRSRRGKAVIEPLQKRLLLICSWFPADPGKAGLLNEFADAAIRAGAAIDVIALEWRDVDRSPAAAIVPPPAGMRVFRYQPLILTMFGRLIGLIAKWVGSSPKTAFRTAMLLFQNKYDVVVVQSPSSAWAPVLVAIWFCSGKKYLIQWDFVPFHMRAMGLISEGLAYRALLWLETRLIRGFDVIGCMSPMNIAFLKQNYKLKPHQRVEVLPIWTVAAFPEPGPRDELRARYELPLDKKVAVFGGTLSKGRGIDDILAAADIAATSYPDIVFLIIGNGPIANEVESKAKASANVIVKRAIPKTDYVQLLGACDCGIVATQRDTGVPTFPSKTMDYFRAAVPVVASIETSTDFGSFLEENHAGICVDAGDHLSLARSVNDVATDHVLTSKLKNNGRRLISEYFCVEITYSRVVSL
jgi:glycosyltransferase involved in cell wall biosynthesis